jgi:hypothetical protein
MGFVPMYGIPHSMFWIISFVVYLVNAYAIFKLALIRNILHPWMAFIPIFNLYMFGMVGDTLKYTYRQVDDAIGNIPLAYVLPIASLIATSLGGIFGWAGRLVIQVGSLLVYFLVFSFYSYKNRILFTILSLIPIVGPLLLIYSIRDQRI